MPKRQVIITPRGDNKRGSLFTHVHRKYYKEMAFPMYGPDEQDYWYHKHYYGKINARERVIIPNPERIKQFNSEDGTYFALDFVVDAFERMRSYFETALYRKRIEESELTKMEPARAYTDPVQAYDIYFDIVDSAFKRYVLDSSGVKNFKNYVDSFLLFASKEAHILPVTLGGFVISNFCPVMCSGLAIEIKSANHSNDFEKHQDFIKDPNFEFYRIAAKKFGFFVDKNAPWRLVYNLAALRTNDYGIDFLFDENFLKVQALPTGATRKANDLLLLVEKIADSYNEFSEDFPELRKLDIFSCDVPVNRTLHKRKALDNVYPEYLLSRVFYPGNSLLTWFGVYFRIRLKEADIDVDENYIRRWMRKFEIFTQTQNPHSAYNESLVFFLDNFDWMEYINNTVLNKTRRRWWMDNMSGLGKATMERMAMELSKIPTPKIGGYIHNVTLPNPVDLLNEEELEMLVGEDLEQAAEEEEARAEAQRLIKRFETLKKIKKQNSY